MGSPISSRRSSCRDTRAMSTADLDPLRDLILDDPEQVARLATLTDATDFVTMAVSLAEGHDLEVEPDNVG